MSGMKRPPRSRPGANAHLTGDLAVCAGSCGPENLHLINGLFDCHRNRVPALAIAAQIPSNEIGSGYFQETHPEHLFEDCSHYCELISQPEKDRSYLDICLEHYKGARKGPVTSVPHSLGGTLSPHEWQTSLVGFVHAWLNGQCVASGPASRSADLGI